MKYILYCRKSTESDERQSLSIPAQEREMKEIALKKNLLIHKTYHESKSARTPNKRIYFKNMIEDIRLGHAQGIIVWSVNRLSRNWQEAGEILQLLTDGELKEIVTPERKITTDNSNDILLGVEFGASSQYSKDLSKNVKRGIREKVSRGQYPGAAPLFYRNVGTNKINRSIEPDPEIAHLFEPWIDYILENQANYSDARDWLNDHKIKPKFGKMFKSKASIARMMKSKVYCGILKWGSNEEIKGDWEALISEEKYYRLQEYLGSKHKPIVHTHTKGYKGIMLCDECGCSITCSHKIKNGRSYIYYHCTKKRGKCSQPYLTEEELETQLYENIRKLKINKNVFDKCLELIKDRNKVDIQNYKESKNKDHNRLLEIDEMISELIDMRLKREVETEVYLYKKSQLESEKNKIKEFSNDKEFNRDSWIENIEKFFETCLTIDDIFNNSNIEERTLLVKSLGKNLLLVDGKVSWNFRNPWSLMISEEKSVNSTVWSE